MMKGYVSESSQALLLKGAFLYWRIDNRARIKTLAKNVKTAENPPEPTDTVENSSHRKIKKKERMSKRFNRAFCFFCRIMKKYRMRWFFKVFRYWFIPWLIWRKLFCLNFCETYESHVLARLKQASSCFNRHLIIVNKRPPVLN